jgi:hypothetical protein
MNDMLMGAIATASIVTGLFFLRFWRTTRDRFFLFFALSFFIEGVNRIAMGSIGMIGEDTPGYYLVRLIAYTLILIAILDKNRPRDKDK